MPKARLICADCGKDLGEIETTTGENSHGLCEKCAKKMLKEADRVEEELKEDKGEKGTNTGKGRQA